VKQIRGIKPHCSRANSGHWRIALCHFDQIHRGHKGGVLGFSEINELSEGSHVFVIIPGHEIVKENHHWVTLVCTFLKFADQDIGPLGAIQSNRLLGTEVASINQIPSYSVSAHWYCIKGMVLHKIWPGIVLMARSVEKACFKPRIICHSHLIQDFICVFTLIEVLWSETFYRQRSIISDICSLNKGLCPSEQ